MAGLGTRYFHDDRPGYGIAKYLVGIRKHADHQEYPCHMLLLNFIEGSMRHFLFVSVRCTRCAAHIIYIYS